jgi:NADH:ubiquinone oxidoreductase subunit D
VPVAAETNPAIVNEGAKNLQLKMELSDYFYAQRPGAKVSRNSKWHSMEELITHFLFYSEGPNLPSGFSSSGVEAPKGHLGVSLVSNGGPQVARARVRSSIQVMAGQLTALVQGVALGDFVVIVSGSNIVIGEVDR